MKINQKKNKLVPLAMAGVITAAITVPASVFADSTLKTGSVDAAISSLFNVTDTISGTNRTIAVASGFNPSRLTTAQNTAFNSLVSGGNVILPLSVTTTIPAGTARIDVKDSTNTVVKSLTSADNVVDLNINIGTMNAGVFAPATPAPGVYTFESYDASSALLSTETANITYQNTAPATRALAFPSTVTVTRDGTALTTGGSVDVGDVLTITAVPPAGKQTDTLTVNGDNFTSGNTYTVAADDIVIAATFTDIPATKTITIPANVTVTRGGTALTTGAEIATNDVLTITACKSLSLIHI